MTFVRTSWLIWGGTVVNDSGARRADVRVEGDRITRVRLNLRPGASEQVIDAGGLWLLPGGIDPHAHLSCPRSDPSEEIWVDDFESGTRAALAGGITSVGSIAFPLPGETPLMTLERERAESCWISSCPHAISTLESKGLPQQSGAGRNGLVVMLHCVPTPINFGPHRRVADKLKSAHRY